MNYYEILEVRENASQEVIEMAYKALVRKYHPDVYREDEDFAHDITQQINEAHNVLSDPEARRNYDDALRAERSENGDNDENGENGGIKGEKSRFSTLLSGFGKSNIPVLALRIAVPLLCVVLLFSVYHLSKENSALSDEQYRLNTALKETKETVKSAAAKSGELEERNAALLKDLHFYYNSTCVVPTYSKRYHHYGCEFLNPDHAYILDVDNARRLGYSPCPECWDMDFEDFYAD